MVVRGPPDFLHGRVLRFGFAGTGAGQRQQKAKQCFVPGPFTLEPECAAVTIDHIAHRQWRGCVTDADGIEFPGHHGLGAHHRAVPHQVQMGMVARARQAQRDALDVEFLRQPRGQVDQGLHQREAVNAQPQRHVDRVLRHVHGGQSAHAPADGRHQVCAAHVLHRPAGFQACGCLLRQGLYLLAQCGGLLTHHAQEAGAHIGLQVREVQHVERGLQIGQCAAAAFGHAVQQLVAQRLLLEVACQVVQQQHEAAEHRRPAGSGFRLDGAFVRLVQHRGDLHAQQLAVARGGDELRRGVGRTAIDPATDRVQRMAHQGCVEHGMNRAAQSNHTGAVGQRRGVGQGLVLQPRAIVVQQDAAVQVAHHHALLQLGHQGCQPAAFALDLLAGLLHLLPDIVLQPVALGCQTVDGARQRTRFKAAVTLDGLARLSAGPNQRLLFDARQRLDVVAVQTLRQQCQRRTGHQPGHQGQRQHRGLRRDDNAALHIGHTEPGHQREKQAAQSQQHARGEQDHDAPTQVHGISFALRACLGMARRCAHRNIFALQAAVRACFSKQRGVDAGGLMPARPAVCVPVRQGRGWRMVWSHRRWHPAPGLWPRRSRALWRSA